MFSIFECFLPAVILLPIIPSPNLDFVIILLISKQHSILLVNTCMIFIHLNINSFLQWLASYTLSLIHPPLHATSAICTCSLHFQVFSLHHLSTNKNPGLEYACPEVYDLCPPRASRHNNSRIRALMRAWPRGENERRSRTRACVLVPREPIAASRMHYLLFEPHRYKNKCRMESSNWKLHSYNYVTGSEKTSHLALSIVFKLR